MSDEEHAVLTRFTIDLVTKEPLSERRVAMLAREMTENLHVLLIEPEDEAHVEVDKLAYGHVHDTAAGDRCPVCVEGSLDYRNGISVVEESA